MGTIVEGKIEAGTIAKGSSYVMMPNREKTEVSGLYGETEEEITRAMCGDQIRVRLRGIEEEDILPGFVLCSQERPVHCVSAFEAQIHILELKSILSAGFNCVLHVHAAIEEVTFAALLHKVEKGTGRKSKKPPPFAAKGQSVIARLEVIGGAGAVCVERFEDYPQLGRFTLRDQVSAGLSRGMSLHCVELELRSCPGPNDSNWQNHEAHHRVKRNGLFSQLLLDRGRGFPSWVLYMGYHLRIRW